MNKYKFNYAQKYALWRAYDMKCFYCECPLDFKCVTIDHIVPESIESNPEKYQQIKLEYQLEESFPGFLINNYCNWVPAHGLGCNIRKGKTLLPKTVILFYLGEVKKKLPRVAEELKRLTNNRKQGKLIGELCVAIENNSISVDHVLEILNQMEYECAKKAPLVITFGLNVDQILVQRTLPNNVIENFCNLCDWLEIDLDKNLRMLTSYAFHYTEASSRNGETLSVRLVFPELSFEDKNKLNLRAIEQTLQWWEILEVSNFWEVYQISYKEKYPI